MNNFDKKNINDVNSGIVMFLLVAADVFFFFNTPIALLFLGSTLIFIVVKKLKLKKLLPHFIIFSIPLLFLDDEYVYLLGIGLWLIISVVMLIMSIQNKRRASHCALCHEELTMYNVSATGRLKDNYQLCTKCLSLFDADFCANIEEKTLAEVQQQWKDLHSDEQEIESLMDETDREVEILEKDIH